MAGNLFATYNAPNPPEIQPQEHIIKFENLNPDNYYKQYIPQIIIQQEDPVEEDTDEKAEVPADADEGSVPEINEVGECSSAASEEEEAKV